MNYAVERGRLLPASHYKCHDCDQQAKYYDHHLGYEKEHWLHVQPVCVKCSGLRDIKTGQRRKGA